MDVFDLQAKITLDSSGYERDLDKAAGHISSFATEAEDFFKNIGAAISAAFAVDKVKDFVKGAVSEFARFEQLVGGVDTLFGDSSGKLQENADAAFRTAGMSANEYMDTATSFAASLIQALGGDTASAVDMVDMAVVDMADNANKMGTDIGSIQHAYQGFAKQNYTMLDNLKLGYGGTKSEMAELINDSGILGDTIVEVSTMTKKGNFEEVVSFDTVVEAIHRVQENMGITGTTAQEAASTIEGSVASMKAAWSNWLVGLGDPDADLAGLTDTLVSSFETAASNVIPVVGQIGESLTQVFFDLTGIDISGITNLFGGIAESVSSIGKGFSEGGVSGGFEAITAQIESLTGLDLSGVVDVFTGVGEAITPIGKGFSEGGVSGGFEAIAGQIESLTGLDLSGVVDVFTGVGEAITTIGKGFSEGGVSGGFEAIAGQIESLTGLDLSGVVDVFTGVGEAITTIGKGFSEGGVSGGFEAIVGQIEQLTGLDLSGLKDGISGIAEVFSGLGDAFAEGGIGGAFDYIVSAFKDLTGLDLSGLGEGIRDVVDTISEMAPQIGEKVQEIFGGLKDLFTVFSEYLSALWPIISPIISGLFSAFGTLISTAFETIGNVIGNILSAIEGGVDVVKGVIGAVAAVLKGDFETAAEAIKKAWDGVLTFFGGIASGIMDAFKGLVSAMAGIGRDMWNGLKEGFSAAVEGVKGLGEKITDGFKDVFGIHSPSKVFAEMGRDLMRGLEVGIAGEAGNVQRTIDSLRFEAPVIHTGRVNVSDSTMGRLSAASINSAMSAAQAGGGNGQPVNVNLVVDGRTMAQVLFDPLSGVAKQKGVPVGVW